MTNEFSKALLVNRFEASPENQHNLRTPQSIRKMLGLIPRVPLNMWWPKVPAMKFSRKVAYKYEE